MPKAKCTLCGKDFPADEVLPLDAIRPRVVRLIKRDHPDWDESSRICLRDLNKYRMEYVHQVLEADVGEISVLETEVINSLKEHEVLASNIQKEFESKRTFGERVSDILASFGGSWTFVIAFMLFMSAWILMNSFLKSRPDPYPFILLNLLLSCLAALQAPIIMMSQKRQETRDRLRAESDYKVNLKAELEIRHLHEKVDHLLRNQSQRLFEIQQIELELLRDVAAALQTNNTARSKSKGA